jgi:hypothetical protein
MTENRLFAGWLRSLTGLAAVAGVLALSACGGGSGAPNNFFKSTLTVVPNSVVAYAGMPTLLTITGGAGPFQASSSNPAVLPVAQTVSGRNILLLANNVAADTEVTITVQDLGPLTPVAPQAIVAVTVRAAPLLNTLTITPNLADCGTALCSGQTAVASVKLTGPQGGPLAGHAVRFDVVGSGYLIVSNNPAQPLVSSLTVSSDSTGTASVILKANVNAPTQVAQLGVTDVTSGQVLIGTFTIVQITDGSAIMTVVPSDATITGAFKGICSTGFVTDYYIYGGTPPYRITSTFPNSVVLVNSVVNTNGGFFRAITNGACVDPLTFSILDATGRQTTATLHNVEGTEEVPAVTPEALAVAPTSYTDPLCAGKTFSFVIFGGTPPYNVSTTRGTAFPQIVATSGGSTTISGLPTGSGATSVVILDSGSPQKSATGTITCS